MAEAKKKTITRFGTRYGRTIRERLATVEAGYRGKHKCPYCSYTNVTREAAGIWSCSKCKAKFTSKAYQLTKPTPVKGLEAKQDE
ncbi:TPA: 50S ribosomal protein L37ae [Candidatus Woesearchaeota archaeon]|nr:50S ribosomal protein L37ae [Candidatus Woesearchaeota archaeon]